MSKRKQPGLDGDLDEDARVQKAFKLRDSIMYAVCWKNTALLEDLVRSLLKFSPCAVSLARSGLGRLLCDNAIWESVDRQSSVVLEAVRVKWKAEVDRSACGQPVAKSNLCALAKLKAKPYLKAIADLAEWLRSLDVEPVEQHIARRVAISLVNAGFTSWSHLDGLEVRDIVMPDTLPVDIALITRAIKMSGVLPRLESSGPVQVAVASGPGLAVSPVLQRCANADGTAGSFAPAVLEKAEADWQVEAHKLGVVGLGTVLTPANAISSLASARVAGQSGVQELLDKRVALLKLEANRKSLATVAAGLKSWHSFAVNVLGYRAEVTLPPRSEMDAMKFLTIFRNAATGCNYIGYVKWTCVYLSLSTTWFGDELKLVMKGAKKWALRCSVTSAVSKKLLDEELVAKLVRLADSRGFHMWSCMALVAWEFLLRVQSEAVGIQAGAPCDATALPASRHSGLWIDQSGALVLRLQRRKHRPKGSLLRRRCLCGTVGNQRCVVHRLQPVLEKLVPGAVAFGITAYDFLCTLKKFLDLLAVDGSQSFTLKAFRAGKATALAEAGAPLGQLLAAGEWRSKAILNYVDEDVFDGAQLIATEMEHSDCE